MDCQYYLSVHLPVFDQFLLLISSAATPNFCLPYSSPKIPFLSSDFFSSFLCHQKNSCSLSRTTLVSYLAFLFPNKLLHPNQSFLFYSFEVVFLLLFRNILFDYPVVFLLSITSEVLIYQ